MVIETEVCIVGGGPAGMLLGLLLAKQGIETVVLEQHQDFQREYRGEVLMPRFAQLFSQLGLLQYIESFPHSKLDAVEVFAQDRRMMHLDFTRIDPGHPYAIWMPQPIFLNALLEKARQFPQFHMHFGTSAEQLLTEAGWTRGVIARQGNETMEIRAKVTVGADGRTSRIHRLGGFENAYESYDFDVLWFSLPRPADYKTAAGFYFCRHNRGYIVLPKYPDLLQIGLLTKPGDFVKIRGQGVPAMQKVLSQGPALVQPFAASLQDFTPFHPLQARIAYTREWAQNGLLLIGDAAHTCSPAGAIGVSVALETAAVAAGVIARALKTNDVSQQILADVQAQRDAEVRHIQGLQERITRLLFTSVPGMMTVLPYLAQGAAALGLVQTLPKKLLVAQHRPVLPPELPFTPT